MNIQQLMAMELHESYSIFDYVNEYRERHEWVVRVPGGWIYYGMDLNHQIDEIPSSSVFVPEPQGEQATKAQPEDTQRFGLNIHGATPGCNTSSPQTETVTMPTSTDHELGEALDSIRNERVKLSDEHNSKMTMLDIIGDINAMLAKLVDTIVV